MMNLLIKNELQMFWLEKIEIDTERDYFLSAKEAKNYGLIDKIIENKG